MADEGADSRVGAADEIPKPPTALKTGSRENRTVDVGDVLRELEESEAGFAPALIGHDEDDSMLRE